MATKIEWTDETWNPLRAIKKGVDQNQAKYGDGDVGWHCELDNAECIACYAQAINQNRFGTGLPYTRSSRDQVDIVLHEPTLMAPLSWRKPKTIFPCSMTDLFGAFHTDEMINEVQAVMALSDRHRFIVLTKRADRLPVYYGSDEWAMVEGAAQRRYMQMTGNDPSEWMSVKWPLPNVALLVSAGTMKTIDAKVPHLLNTHAAVRGLSCEPMMGPIAERFKKYVYGEHRPHMSTRQRAPHLDWVIIGVESNGRRVGRLGAFSNEAAWTRAAIYLVNVCMGAGVRCFVKQIPINGRVSHNPAEWPEELRVRQEIDWSKAVIA